jgi:ribosomal protein S27E
MVNEYNLSLHREALTPGGLQKKQNIRRFTTDLFNDENDHNPLIARPCTKCGGKGFYRVYDPPKGDVKCEKCDGIGAFEITEAFFSNESPAVTIDPNEHGIVKCPSCGRRFPVYSNQFWTGLRHTCGQKIVLSGAFAEKCWTKNENG